MTYIISQLRAMEQIKADLDVLIVAAPWNESLLRPHISWPMHRVEVSNLATRLAYEQLVLPRRFRNANVLYMPGNFGLLASRVPFVVTVQNQYLFSPRSARGHVERVFLKMTTRRAASVLFISRSLLRSAETSGFSHPNTRVVLSGASEWIDESRAHKDVNEKFFLVLANDYPHKRLEDTVVAWARAYKSDSDRAPQCVIAGSIAPPRRERFVSAVPASLRPRLLFLGHVDRPQVRYLLERALALVSTSELEAFPLTLLEAGSVGCPLILSDIPPHREVAGDRAFFFDVGSVQALADTLRDIEGKGVARSPWEWHVTWRDNAEQVVTALADAAAS